ncbi:MAG: DUF1904 domain-containing protein [Fusobacteriaceae bacterium]
MPHLKFRGIEKEKIISQSKFIIDELTKIVGCEREWFTLEHILTEYIFDGKIIDGGITFVEIFWFPREKEIKDKVANFLTKKLKELNNDRDVTVIFFSLVGENYYDNGTHF